MYRREETMMNFRRTLALAILFTVGAFAQDFRATIQGQVVDPSGAAIPGATVKAINIGTNAGKEAQTTADGIYTIPYLDPGTYDIEVSAPGFQTLKGASIVLQVAQKLNLPLKLVIGQATTEI